MADQNRDADQPASAHAASLEAYLTRGVSPRRSETARAETSELRKPSKNATTAGDGANARSAPAAEPASAPRSSASSSAKPKQPEKPEADGAAEPGERDTPETDGARTAGAAGAGTVARATAEASTNAAAPQGGSPGSGSVPRGATRIDQHSAAAGTATGVGATATATGFLGRPSKAVLAGAAVAGAILISVPLLVVMNSNGNDSDSGKPANAGGADTVLNVGGGKAGDFVAESPSPTGSEKSARPPKKGDAGKEDAGKEEKKNPKLSGAVPDADPERGSDSGSSSPEGTSKKEEEKKKEETAGKKESSLPAVLTRVLIKNNTNRTCVDVPGYSSGSPDGPVHHWKCDNSTNDNQLWNVEQRYANAGPGGVPLFQIRNVMDSLCLDLPNYRAAPGATKVTEYRCNGTTRDNQLWWLDKQSNGKFWIRNFASNNMCLDSYRNSESNRNLIIWPCAPESQNNHEWIFTRS